MQSLEIIFTAPGVEEDGSPNRLKLDRTPYGLIVRHVQGLRFSLSRESFGPDKPRYRVTQGASVGADWADSAVGPYRVASGAVVHISDPEFVTSMVPIAREDLRKRGVADIALTFEGSRSLGLANVAANSATFGPEALSVLQRHPSLATVQRGDDPFACSAFNATAAPGLDFAIVVPRGGCTFVDKARVVRAAGFVAAIVTNDSDDRLFTPGGDAVGDALSPSSAEPAALVLISRKHGDQLRAALQRHAPIRIAAARSRVEDMSVIVNGLVLDNAKLAPST